MRKILKGLNILITAGPVWVEIDKVRVITNIFGGALGYIIARRAHQKGAKITLMMGPGRTIIQKSTTNFKIIRFKYFDEILNLVRKEVGTKKYHVMIHSAAISDYMPINTGSDKIKSGKKSLYIKLIPTIKIVNLIKKIDKKIFLIKFKLEVNKKDHELINIAYKNLFESKADLIVANDFKTVSRSHKAFIIDREKQIKKCIGKEVIADNLLRIMLVKMKKGTKNKAFKYL